MDEAYLKILRMVESGAISAEEAEMLLDALGVGSEQVIRTANGTVTGWERRKACWPWRLTMKMARKCRFTSDEGRGCYVG